MAEKINIVPQMVFPTTKMESVNKLITEGSLTRLINKLIDTDSYIIPLSTSFDANMETTYVSSIDTKLIKIQDISFSDDIEFMLHGYYFNLGAVTDVIGPLRDNQLLAARIFIDTTNSDYPELHGELDAVNDLASIEVTDDVVFEENQTVVPNEYLTRPVHSVEVIVQTSSSQNQNRGASYNSETHTITYSGELSTGETLVGYKIYYVSYHTLIQLYVLDYNEPIPDPDTNSLVLPNSYDTYTMNLIYRYNGQYYFPMNNFAKFKFHSIESIDGGEI